MSEQMDDSDLEVSPVASPPPTPPSAPVGSETVVSFTSATQTPSPSPSRHVSVMAPRPHTQQLLRAASVAGLLTLLIAAGLLVPSANREALVRFITPPTPSPTLAPERGYDAFLWEHSVPWGQLLIDSQPGPDVRGSAVRQNAQGVWEGAAFHLPRGHHTLEYRAAPFPPLVCVLSVPSSRTDTCPLDHSFDYSNLAPRTPATRLLDLQATMRHLPTAQADALVAAAQAQLNALAARLGRSALSGGDHFLDVTGDVVQVSTTVYVQPQFALDTSITDYDGLPCMTLCTIHDLVPEAASPEEWTILAPVMPTWRYTNAAGELLLAEGPATVIGAQPTVMVPLVTRWQDGAWQPPAPVVEARQTDPLICPTAEATFAVLRATPAATTVDERFQAPFRASTAELGCLLVGSETDPGTGTPTGPIGWILYRAGALVAANAEAHRDFPTLPVASAHERALAQAVAPTTLS